MRNIRWAPPAPTPDNVRAALDGKLDPNDFSAEEIADARAAAFEQGRAILESTTGRARLASEQRQFDAIETTIGLLDKLNGRRADLFRAERAKLDRHANEAAELRSQHLSMFSAPGANRGAADIGQELRDAIGEVLEGRAQSFVELEGRALAESGTGGYGVATAMAAPVFSLAANSVVMSLPGINMITASNGDRMRFPRFNAVSVAGTAEAATLNAAATDLDAIDIVFQKFSTYETISTELEEDFSADALEVLGRRMLRDLAARVDSGFLQGTGASDTVGIFTQPGVSTTSVAALPTDFDKVSEAIYQLELNDGTPSAWIMHPRSWRIYKQIKTGIASDKTTLLADPQLAPKSLAGLPVFTSSAISLTSGAGAGSTVAVVDPTQIVVVTRRPARLEVSRDVNFSTDQVAIRATTRVGLGVIDPAGGISLLTDVRAS
jgi:HK97 family phage major capsid protein